MLRRFFTFIFQPILNFLKSPGLVLLICFFAIVFALVKNGTAERYWSFKSSKSNINFEIKKYKKMITDVDVNIEKYFDLSYLKREAIDRFDLAGSNDLIFVFSQEKKVDKDINFN